jgi:UPF0755 protein
MKKLSLLLFLLFSSLITYLIYDFSLSPNASLQKESIIDLNPGTSFASMLKILKANGIEIPETEAKISAKTFHFDRKIKAGEYLLKPNLSSLEILKALTSNKALQHPLLVKEGHSKWDIADSWSKASKNFDRNQFLKLIQNPELISKVKIPSENDILVFGHLKDQKTFSNFRSLEGYLFPETYNFQKYDSPKVIVEEMLAQFERRARPILNQHPWAQTSLGFYRLLTLASVVEKETGKSDEQPLVASVFWNRLNKKMRLQSDPTTIYGLMPNFDGNLKKIHLQTFSIYNTYTIPELPVGPICNPGEKALRAVLHPAASEYLYFVGRGDGTHEFAKDYATHNRNVQKFQLKK